MDLFPKTFLFTGSSPLAFFCGRFLHSVKKAYSAGTLKFHGSLQELNHPENFEALLKHCLQPEWIVYSKPPFGGPDQVLDYLGRYTHRVAISNHRLVRLAGGKVTFRWCDYMDGNKQKLMALDALEFIRRFLVHVLPHGFIRICHCGFLAHPCCQQNLSLCRQFLGVAQINM